MKRSAPFSAEEGTPRELRRSIWGLLIMLIVIVLLVAPFVYALPLGPSPRRGILAWLLVVLAFYWLYAGMGYWPLLILQLLLFSCAAALLTGRTALGLLDVHRLPVLRHTGSVLILLGAACAASNLCFMLWTLVVKSRAHQRGGAVRALQLSLRSHPPSDD